MLIQTAPLSARRPYILQPLTVFSSHHHYRPNGDRFDDGTQGSLNTSRSRL